MHAEVWHRLCPCHNALLYSTKLNSGIECSNHLQRWQKGINSLAEPWLTYAIDSWDILSVKHKDQHLDQALLFKNHEMEVLLHCFDKGGVQSYIHNHKASFLSLCLNGSYTESKWLVDHESLGHHVVYCR